MATIWKERVLPRKNVYFPEGSKVLSAHVQGYSVVVWAIVYDTEAPRREYPISVYNTGGGAPAATSDESFVDTVHLDRLVFHVFCKSGDKL